jgi:hypothetical protein
MVRSAAVPGKRIKDASLAQMPELKALQLLSDAKIETNPPLRISV